METVLSAREIDQLVAWGGKFLRAASIKSEIMELLIGLGYSDTEHKQGWDLDEPTFRRATAALLRLHPEQHGYIFGDGLSAKTGPESLGSVQTFLDRYVALRDGTDQGRADKREADRAAASTLESRHIVTPAIEQHLRGLIEIVKQAAPPRAPALVTASEESLQNAAKMFEAWLRDWRTTASAGMFRRDYRIMLGISRRRTVETSEPTPEHSPQPPAMQA